MLLDGTVWSRGGLGLWGEEQEEEKALQGRGDDGTCEKRGEPVCCRGRELRREAWPPHLFPCSEPWFNQQRKPQGPDAYAGERGDFKLRKMSCQIRGQRTVGQLMAFLKENKFLV